MKTLSVLLVLALLAAPVLASAEDGAALYKANCAMCHKADGSGNPATKAPDLRSASVQGMDDAKLAGTITGLAKHPPMVKKLTADQVKAIVAYLRTLKK